MEMRGSCILDKFFYGVRYLIAEEKFVRVREVQQDFAF